ncbi:MAG: O-antigen ligase family protein, partial [Parvularculaceae bacterium]
TYLRTHRELLNLMKWALAGAIVSAGIAVMEFGTGTLMASVLSPLIPANAEWLRTAQAQKIPDGVFRAQANHTHPLSLGEFLAMCAPFAVGFAIAAKRGFPRAFWAAAFLLIVAGSLATSSRAALLSLIVALGAMGAILLHRAQQRPRLARFRPMIGLAACAVILVSPVMAVGAMALIGGSGGQSASNSTEARVEQIKQAWPKILKRPVLGYGVGRAARILGFWGRGLTIDNYYLSLALELGLLGPLVFLSIFIGLAVVAGKRSARGDPEIRYLYMAFVASAVSLLVTRSVISLTGNLGVIFVLLGAFAGAGVRDAAARRRQPALAAADEVDEIPRHEPGRAIAKYV